VKHSEIVSAIVGGTFFAVPFLGLSMAALPSIAIGAAAFGATELVLGSRKSIPLKESNRTLYDKIEKAKNENQQIRGMVDKIEDLELKKAISEISESTAKIIATVEKKRKESKVTDSFFDYYLPVSLNILKRYDEIENQNLQTAEAKKFMNSAHDMIIAINSAFKKQLSSLYQAEMIDSDAEMKVFNSMLKADGYDADGEILLGSKEDKKVEK